MPAPAKERPICTAVLVCDSVYVDKTTGKQVLAGVFNNLAVTALPSWWGGASVFFSLTNGKGEFDVRLRIEQDDGERLFDFGGPMTISNPLAIIDHFVQLPPVLLAKPGKHWAAVYADEELLNRRPFTVALASDSKEEGSNT